MIVHANYRQFDAKETIGFLRVESRMLLWGKSGGGWVTVDGQRHRLMTGDYLFLPWGHRILYEADEKEPFWVGGIHLIPQLKGNRMNEFGVSHRPGDAWAGRSWRKDINWPQLQGTIRGTMEEGRLAWLTAYIVDFFHQVGPEEKTLRELGGLLVREIARAARSAGTREAGPVPAALRRMQDYLSSRLQTTLAVRHLARSGACSVASVHRLFHRFLNTTPRHYISRLRTEEAKRLLRTTALPISEVGARVGYEDPFHFSRFFKHQAGFPPSVYRRRASIL